MVQGDYGTPSNRNTIVSERWQYTPHTSDPSGTEKGDEWLRVDLDSGDKIATLRFQHTSGGDVWDIPVFPVSESTGAEIKKVLRIGTPNGEGFIPLFENGGAYPQRAVQVNGTRHGMHDSLTAIPDSGILRYGVDEGSGSALNDSVGSNDGSISGATWISSADYVGGEALQTDGVDGEVRADQDGTLTGLSEITVLCTIDYDDSTGSREGIINVFNFSDADERVWRLENRDPDDIWEVALSSDGTSASFFHASKSTINIGPGLNRIGFRWRGTDSYPDLIVNNTAATMDYNDAYTDFTSLYSSSDSDLIIGNDDGDRPAQLDVLDDIIIHDTYLSDSQIQEDYNRQPWS